MSFPYCRSKSAPSSSEGERDENVHSFQRGIWQFAAPAQAQLLGNVGERSAARSMAPLAAPLNGGVRSAGLSIRQAISAAIWRHRKWCARRAGLDHQQRQRPGVGLGRCVRQSSGKRPKRLRQRQRRSCGNRDRHRQFGDFGCSGRPVPGSWRLRFRVGIGQPRRRLRLPGRRHRSRRCGRWPGDRHRQQRRECSRCQGSRFRRGGERSRGRRSPRRCERSTSRRIAGVAQWLDCRIGRGIGKRRRWHRNQLRAGSAGQQPQARQAGRTADAHGSRRPKISRSFQNLPLPGPPLPSTGRRASIRRKGRPEVRSPLRARSTRLNFRRISPKERDICTA
jgi:hypothetical protein